MQYESSTRGSRSILREIPAPEVERTQPTTGARALVEVLVAAGVDTFFGIPGGPVSPVFDAVLQNRRAHLVESRHESAAAFAAVGYHRASGRVPAVIVTAGPGATNAVTGIVSAHLERVPMLVICGDVAWAASGGRLFQDSGPEGIDVEQMFARFMRLSVRVAQARSAAPQALAALHAATDPERPGPALLVVPIHNGAGVAAPLRVARGRVARSLAPPADAVEETYEILRGAERPLVVIGAGCRPFAREVAALLDALEVPFVTTPRGKGIVSELHPRSLRQGGFAASMWSRRYTKLDDQGRGVDGALVLGTDLDDCSVGPTPYLGSGGRLAHVDTEATVFNRNIPTSLAVLADVGAFVEDLHALVELRGFRKKPGATAFLRAVKNTSPFELPSFASDESPVIKPQRAIADLERAAGESACFVADIGEHTLFALHYLTARGADAFDVRLGLGSMGSGIASAIGLALGDRARSQRRPVVCVCGDGGMQMAGMEALVAIRERLPILFAVFNDARYNMVYHGYKQVFGREAAWESPWVDFVAWANAMGMPGARIERAGEINPELLELLSGDGGPAVLDIRIDRDVQMSGGGRNEALLHMSMLGGKK